MEILNEKALREHRAALALLADPKREGVLFDEFTTDLASHKADEPVLFIGFGRRYVGIGADGNQFLKKVTKREASDDQEAEYTYEEVVADSRGWKVGPRIAGSAATNKTVLGVRIPAGVCLIIGGASTAKTPFAHAIAAAGGRDYAVVRYGEPLAGYCLDPEEMAVKLGAALISQRDIVLDSVKDILAFASGGAMTSGISRGSFPILSDLSALAAERGCTIYVPFNPSNTDEKTVNALIEAAKSNVTTTIVGERGSSESESKWSVFARRGEGLLREKGSLVGRFEQNELTMTIFSASGKKEVSSGVVERSVSTNARLHDVELDAVLRKSLSN